MSVRLWLTATFLLLPPGAGAQARREPVYVKETVGIRRTSYPVNARVPFLKGALPDSGNARLLFNEKEVPAQYAVESRWPDQSVRWLEVDFNASIGPLESQTYQLEYGPNVRAEAKPRGLVVNEDADGIQVGNVRFSKAGAPLLLSVNYRGDEISTGKNGLAVTDVDGESHDLTKVESLTVEIVKRGPLYVILKYSGRIVIDAGYQAPFVMTVEMPNSKSWVKVSARVEDRARRLREISFHTPLAFGPLPWVWDFGTDRWSYGSLRSRTDTVTLDQVVKEPGTVTWKISTGNEGQERLYETAGAATQSKLVRWGHYQGEKEAVAFAIAGPARQPGRYRFTMDGAGRASFRFAPAQPAVQHLLTVYEHFISTPVHIGAATSPVSMMSPLVASSAP